MIFSGGRRAVGLCGAAALRSLALSQSSEASSGHTARIKMGAKTSCAEFCPCLNCESYCAALSVIGDDSWAPPQLQEMVSRADKHAREG